MFIAAQLLGWISSTVRWRYLKKPGREKLAMLSDLNFPWHKFFQIAPVPYTKYEISERL
jgi:hypothetical protein